MSHHDDQTGRDEAGGASPAHHASSGDKLAQVITLHQHTGTRDAEPRWWSRARSWPAARRWKAPRPGHRGPGWVSRRDLYRSDLHAAGRPRRPRRRDPSRHRHHHEGAGQEHFLCVLRRRGPRSAVAGHPRHQPV